MSQFTIAVIDDQPGQQIGAQVQAILEREGSYRVDLMGGPLPNGLEVTHPRPDLIVPVLPWSQQTAAHLLTTLGAKEPDIPSLPIIAATDLDGRLDELLLGATDFLVTPVRAAEVRARVRRLLTGSSELGRARVHERGPDTVELTQLVGEDPVFVAVKRKLPLVARCEAPVLLTGETGTGKELCGQALHYLSRRAGKPFLPVNCGAIPVELFESELFGHLKGAFTGAWAAQPGLIAEAEGGTL